MQLMQVSSSLWTCTNVDGSKRVKQVLVLQFSQGLQAIGVASTGGAGCHYLQPDQTGWVVLSCCRLTKPANLTKEFWMLKGNWSVQDTKQVRTTKLAVLE